MDWQKLRHRLEFGIVRCFVFFVQCMPISVCKFCADVLGYFVCNVLKLRQSVTLDNLRHAFPDNTEAENKKIALKMWQHLFLMVMEIAHIPYTIHEDNWEEYIELENKDLLLNALAENRPVVLISAHFGNFELGGYLLGLYGYPTHSVARTLDNPYLHDFVDQFRSKTGQHMIPKNGGYEQIIRVLDDKGTLAFLADQYAGETGVKVNFFGRPVSAHKAIALFALQHDALVVVANARRTDKPLHYQLTINAITDPTQEESVTDVKALTQWYTAEIEKFVREAPYQYWWLHTRWRLPNDWGKRGKRRRLKRKQAREKAQAEAAKRSNK